MGMYGGGGAPAPAEPTAEERRLQKIQADSAEEQLRLGREQQDDTAALTPLLLEEYGLTKTIDPVTGKPVYTKTPNALIDKRKEIEGMQLDRSLKALKGELPVTETLAKELQLGERTLDERLSKQLGSGWETTTAGIQAKAEYQRMSTSLKEAEQKDQLTTAEALSINRQNSRAGSTQGTYDTSSQGRVGASSLYGGAAGTAGGALGYYGSLRGNSETYKERMQKERSDYIGGGLALGGSIGGAAILF